MRQPSHGEKNQNPVKAGKASDFGSPVKLLMVLVRTRYVREVSIETTSKSRFAPPLAH